jgi:SagB-type dehydrogenase family enzyme
VHTAVVGGQRRLIAQSSAARPPLIVRDSRALQALGALPRAFNRDTATAAWRDAGISEGVHEQLWEGFQAAGLFSRETDNSSWWDELGWGEARVYHDATRDYPFLQMNQPGAVSADRARMEDYREESRPPSIYQHVGDQIVQLPKLEVGEAPDDRLGRMSATERTGREGLALLLDVCFGERGKIAVAGEGQCLLKSIPSGGARHPTEVFLAAFDLDGLDAGVYHYDVEHHQLELVRGGQQSDRFASATLDLFAKHAAPPCACLVFTSRVERAMWRYRDPRSFRAILIDAGHAVMAYRQVARLLGFKTYALQKMRDGDIARLVRVDPVVQPPLYVGTLVR